MSEELEGTYGMLMSAKHARKSTMRRGSGS